MQATPIAIRLRLDSKSSSKIFDDGFIREHQKQSKQMIQLARRRFKRTIIFALTVGLVFQTTQVFAQSTTPSQSEAATQNPASSAAQFASSSWNVACQPDSGATNLVCELSQTITLVQTGQLFMRISVGAEPHHLVLQLPHGLKLDEGVQIQVDDDDILPLEFFTSNQAGTFTRTLMSKNLISSLKKGFTISITVHSTSGEALVTPISLLGFSLGFARLI